MQDSYAGRSKSVSNSINRTTATLTHRCYTMADGIIASQPQKVHLVDHELTTCTCILEERHCVADLSRAGYCIAATNSLMARMELHTDITEQGIWLEIEKSREVQPDQGRGRHFEQAYCKIRGVSHMNCCFLVLL